MKPDGCLWENHHFGWAEEGKSRKGRPTEKWRRTVERERNQQGFFHMFKSWKGSTEQTRMNKVYPWTYSLQGEKELNQ